jgi:hypothetical protein
MGVETADEEESASQKKAGLTAGIFPDTGLPRRFGRRGRREGALYPGSRLPQHGGSGVLAPSIISWRRF